MKVKGYLVILNGDCKKNAEGIYTVFCPTKNKEKALEYCRGNGDIINAIKYEIFLDDCSDEEKLCILDRIVFFNN